jgi:hypothetical protein
MGKHSAVEHEIFWRSTVLFLLKWLAVGILPVLALWGTWRLVRQPENVRVGGQVINRTPSPTPSPAETPQEMSGVPSESPQPPPEETPRGQLQVLNGSSTPGLGRSAARKLDDAGYEVVAVRTAARHYDRTTVFFQPESRTMADEVAGILGTTNVQPAPDTVTREVLVSVVVGDDYQG